MKAKIDKESFQKWQTWIEHEYKPIKIDNVRYIGRYVHFKASRDNSDKENLKYSRTTFHGRHIWNALCFHGFERVIRELFRFGAEVVGSGWGNWKSLEEFEDNYDVLACKNVGSYFQPTTMPELCNDCDCEA